MVYDEGHRPFSDACCCAQRHCIPSHSTSAVVRAVRADMCTLTSRSPQHNGQHNPSFRVCNQDAHVRYTMVLSQVVMYTTKRNI